MLNQPEKNVDALGDIAGDMCLRGADRGRFALAMLRLVQIALLFG